MNATLFQSRAIRTAAIATGLVAAVLAAVLVATNLLVQHSLLDGVDQRLEEHLDRIDTSTTSVALLSASPDRDFDEPILAWLVRHDGSTTSSAGAPALPAPLHATGSAREASIGGTAFLLEGASIPRGAHIVVAASLSQTSRAVGMLVVSELIVGPLLLAMVFAGAVIIGRRVAGPVEHMRQRQLTFTADASHELRTPLSVIQAEASLALTGDDGELRTALGRITTEGQRMRGILEDLLWLARFDSEPARPASETLDLATLAASAVDRFTALAAQRGVTVELDAPHAPVLICAPPEWLHRLVAILVDNACRHAGHTGRVCVGVRDVDRYHAQLSVSNDGEGIPETALKSIFDRFHRATSKGDGAGLGLAIADAIVRATHGSWNVRNLAEGGARFAVTWRLDGA